MTKLQVNRFAVAIVGSQGCGKTTLIKNVEKQIDSLEQPTLITKEVARICPYPIGVKSDILAQTWILRTQDIIESVATQLQIPVLLDRCLLDQYAYYCYWNGRSSEAESLIERALSRYRKVFFCLPTRTFLKMMVLDQLIPLTKLKSLILFCKYWNAFQMNFA